MAESDPIDALREHLLATGFEVVSHREGAMSSSQTVLRAGTLIIELLRDRGLWHLRLASHSDAEAVLRKIKNDWVRRRYGWSPS